MLLRSAQYGSALRPRVCPARPRPAKSGGEGTFSVFLPGANIAELEFWSSTTQAKAQLASLQAKPSLGGVVTLFRVANVVAYWPPPLGPSDPLVKTWSAALSAHYRGIVTRCLSP